MNSNKLRIWRCILLMIFPFTVMAQEMPVPANFQAVLFKKIFDFNKTLQAKGNFEVIVLGSNSSAEIVSAFKAAGINAKAVSGNKVPDGTAVVYVLPGTEAPQKYCADNGVLSITGVPSLVESGKVAIGIGTEGGKPKILINFDQLKAEKQDIAASLLTIAKVIK